MRVKLSQKKFTVDNDNICKLRYQIILKKYSDYLDFKALTQHTISTSKSDIKKFLEYLIKSNVDKLDKITNENILNYIFSLNNYCIGTKSSKISKIRVFLKFAYVNSYTTIDFSLAVPKVKINHNSIIHHTIWTSDEVNRILKSIDITTSKGKRDYAILTLMAHLGLRFCDIRNLQFKNINWQNNTINLTQSKTKKYISLPLTNEIGNAIIDYIKNGRPNVKSQYVFLSNKSEPFGERNNLSYSFKKYLKLAGIDISNKKNTGIYTLRHSFATTLLQKNTPLSTISSILGHTDINNTAIYLKVDISSLRECCLSLEV